MTDLDRLLELRRIYRMTPKELDECKSLKAKIEGKIEKGDKFDVLNEVFEDYPKGWLDMKEDLESQVGNLKIARQASITVRDSEIAKLKEELNGVKFGETKNLYDIIDEYKSTLDKIREFNILLNNQYLEDLLAKHEGKQ